MSDFVPERRGPGRPPKAENTRADAVKRERRRRADTSEDANMQLSVPESLKEPGFVYRWVNDTQGGRVRRLYDQDWDKVDDPKIDGHGEGTVVMRNVEKEKPLRAVLMKKPAEFYQEDTARKMARLKETEDAMMRGPVASKNDEGLHPGEAYVPAGHTNSVRRSS